MLPFVEDAMSPASKAYNSESKSKDKNDHFSLIEEVSRRQALWDTHIKISSRKEICAIQWKEVAEILHTDVDACKKRFKSFRDCYRTEVRKIQQNLITESTWPYFRHLEFLRHIFDPDKLLPFPAQPLNIEELHKDDFIADVGSDESVAFEVMGDIFKCESPEIPTKDTNKLSAKSIPQPTISKPSVAKRPRQKLQSTDEPVENRSATVIGNSAMVLKPQPASPQKDDADYNFLVSLIPHMKSLSDMGNLKFRMEISRILMDLKREDMQHASPAEPRTSVLPKLTPAPAAGNFTSRPESTRYALNFNTTLNSSYFMDSSPVECDVKVENESFI